MFVQCFPAASLDRDQFDDALADRSDYQSLEIKRAIIEGDKDTLMNIAQSLCNAYYSKHLQNTTAEEDAIGHNCLDWKANAAKDAGVPLTGEI